MTDDLRERALALYVGACFARGGPTDELELEVINELVAALDRGTAENEQLRRALRDDYDPKCWNCWNA